MIMTDMLTVDLQSCLTWTRHWAYGLIQLLLLLHLEPPSAAIALQPITAYRQLDQKSIHLSKVSLRKGLPAIFWALPLMLKFRQAQRFPQDASIF